MSTEDPLKNWQLEDRKQPDPEQWKLEDADQDLDKHLQLQEGETNEYWQPIEYERAPQTRRNWVLPSVLIVALLAVLGYVGWIALGQLGGGLGPLGGLAGTAPTETPTLDAAAAAALAASPTPAAPTPTTEPTATSAPVETPTPLLAPTPTIAMGELISGTVNAVQGVNARREPNGEIIRTLAENEGVIVTRQDGDWLQVILSDGTTVAWISSEFVNRTPQMVPLEQLATIFTAAGLPVPTPVAAPLTGTRLTTTLDLTGTTSLPGTGADLTSTLSLGGAAPQLTPNGVIPTVPFTNALPAVGPALTVSDTTGVNARTAASTGGAVLLVVPNGAVLPVLGRTAAGDWLQVRLPDGQNGWMFAAAVIASPDAASAPVVEDAAVASTDAVTETVAATPTAAVTTGTTVTATAPLATGAPTGATATIASPLGANLRAAPSRDLEPVYFADPGVSFAAIGRSGDDLWVQVVLPDGSAAWVLAALVEVSVGIETLPVTQP